MGRGGGNGDDEGNGAWLLGLDCSLAFSVFLFSLVERCDIRGAGQCEQLFFFFAMSISNLR